MKKFELIQESGWKNETGFYTEKIKEFLKKSRQKNYDPFSELHISGGNADILRDIAKGEAEPSSINVLRENGVITQIHVFFPGKNVQGLDFYLTGRALKDFLEKDKE